MRIIAGAWRGRTLIAPPGEATRPTADRVRQALFDMLLHAPWGGPDILDGARVLDAFAGTGALGLEALSRGATHATFIENDSASLSALRANIARLHAEESTRIVAGDALAPPRAAAPCTLVFLDPPYGKRLLAPALAAISKTGWFAPGALIVAETSRSDPAPTSSPLAERLHGAARISVWTTQSG